MNKYFDKKKKSVFHFELKKILSDSLYSFQGRTITLWIALLLTLNPLVLAFKISPFHFV